MWPTGTTSTSHELTGGCGENKTRQPIRERHVRKQPMRKSDRGTDPSISPVLPWLPQQYRSYQGLCSPPPPRPREQRLLVHGSPGSEGGVESKLLRSRCVMGQCSLQFINTFCVCLTYQVVIASSSCYYIGNSALALLNKGHKLEDDPAVLLHLVDEAQIDHHL